MYLHQMFVVASRLSNRSSRSPDRMSSSCCNPSSLMESSSIMTQSLDPNLLTQTVQTKISTDQIRETNGILDGNTAPLLCIIL